MKQKIRHGDRSVTQRRIPMWLIVTLCLALSFSILHPVTAPEPVAADGKEQIVTLLRDLADDGDVDCERTLRLVLGVTDDDEALDNERLLRLLLGIDEGDEIGRDQIDRLLQGLSDEEGDD